MKNAGGQIRRAGGRERNTRSIYSGVIPAQQKRQASGEHGTIKPLSFGGQGDAKLLLAANGKGYGDDYFDLYYTAPLLPSGAVLVNKVA